METANSHGLLYGGQLPYDRAEKAVRSLLRAEATDPALLPG